MGAVSAECVNHEGGVALPGIGGGLPCCGHEAGVPHQGQHKILGNKIRAEALAVGRSASARRLTRGRRPASHKPAGRSRRNRTRRPVPGGLSRFGEHVRAALTMRSQLRSASARNAGLFPADPVASATPAVMEGYPTNRRESSSYGRTVATECGTRRCTGPTHGELGPGPRPSRTWGAPDL